MKTSIQEVATWPTGHVYQIYEKVTPAHWIIWPGYYTTVEEAQAKINRINRGSKDASQKNR